MSMLFIPIYCPVTFNIDCYAFTTSLHYSCVYLYVATESAVVPVEGAVIIDQIKNSEGINYLHEIVYCYCIMLCRK